MNVKIKVGIVIAVILYGVICGYCGYRFSIRGTGQYREELDRITELYQQTRTELSDARETLQRSDETINDLTGIQRELREQIERDGKLYTELRARLTEVEESDREGREIVTRIQRIAGENIDGISKLRAILLTLKDAQ